MGDPSSAYFSELDSDLGRANVVNGDKDFVVECVGEIAKIPDNYATLGHSCRTKKYLVRAGEVYELDFRRLVLGGWLHDAGKIKNPMLFAFSGVYNKEQRRMRKAHPEESSFILRDRFPFTSRFVRYHHLGDKYPDYDLEELGFSDYRDVALYSYLLEVCDKFDAALTRKDRGELSQDERISRFRNLGWKDTKIVDTLFRKGVFEGS